MSDTETTLAQASEWTTLLEQLMPPETTKVQDVSGAYHLLRSNLPATVERRIMDRLSALDLQSVDLDIEGVVRSHNNKDVRATMESVVNSLLQLMASEEVLNTVADCFALAHPKAVRMAAEAVKADPDLADYLPVDRPVTAADLFSAADLVSGVVPFGLRDTARMSAMARSLLPSKP